MMQFRPEVQEQFRKAGWYPGRNVRETFDAIKGFASFPDFLKEFLYEYGDLDVPCLDPGNIGLTAILNLKALPMGYFLIDQYLSKNSSYGHNLMTFPFGDYHLDAAAAECDAEGRVYMNGDFSCMMADNFKEGVERIIMEDYSHSVIWEAEKKDWVSSDWISND